MLDSYPRGLGFNSRPAPISLIFFSTELLYFDSLCAVSHFRSHFAATDAYDERRFLRSMGYVMLSHQYDRELNYTAHGTQLESASQCSANIYCETPRKVCNFSFAARTTWWRFLTRVFLKKCTFSPSAQPRRSPCSHSSNARLLQDAVIPCKRTGTLKKKQDGNSSSTIHHLHITSL